MTTIADDAKRKPPDARDDVQVIPEDYCITIPRRVRELPGFEPGSKVAWLVQHGSVHLVPVPGLDALQGIAHGADTTNIREKTDRF